MTTNYILKNNGKEIEAFEDKKSALNKKNFLEMTRHIEPKTGERNNYKVFRRTEIEVRQ